MAILIEDQLKMNQDYLDGLYQVRMDMLAGGLVKSFTKCDTSIRFSSIAEINQEITNTLNKLQVLDTAPLSVGVSKCQVN